MMTTITPCLSPLALIVGREPQGDLAESPTQRDQTAIANQDLFILRRRRRRRQRQRRVPYRILTGEKSLLNGWRQAGRQAGHSNVQCITHRGNRVAVSVLLKAQQMAHIVG